ncbi:hypothetical protein [Brevundimonas sp.]|uniref:hypothetical protein n=1 Tax=Brevundimonas sp. TaxID=1871086 RepID=UPI0025F5B50F|nr:hypothetical protein [Brevundimonas sp.]
MRFAPVLLLLLCWLCTGCAQERPWREPPGPPDPERVSLAAIQANPAAFHGQFVETQGVIATEYHDRQLFMSREDYDGYMDLNGPSLAIDAPPDDPELRPFEGEAVEVTGIFFDGASGHLGGQRGLIVVKSIRELPSRSQLDFFRQRYIPPFLAPWLVLIGVAALAVGLLATRLLAVRNVHPSGGFRRALFFVGVMITGIALVECWAVSGLLDLGFRPPMPLLVSALGTFGLGMAGVLGLWWTLWRGRYVFCLSFMALALATPIAREVSRFDTWRYQVVYPFSPQGWDVTWEADTWPPDPMPEPLDLEEAGYPRSVLSRPPATESDETSTN